MTVIEERVMHAIISYCNRDNNKGNGEKRKEYVENASKDILCALIQEGRLGKFDADSTVDYAVELANKLADKLNK